MSTTRGMSTWLFLVCALLIPWSIRAIPPGPAERATALDQAILTDDVITAWSLAESLVDAPEPWTGRGLAALTWLSTDLARCADGGQLPALERLLDRTDADGWLCWTAWEVLRTNLERCRNWTALDAIKARVHELDGWQIDAAQGSSGIEDAFFRVRTWAPPADAERSPVVRWTQRTAGRLFATTALCLDTSTQVSLRLDTRAPGTIWIDGRLVLMAEPGTRTLWPGPQAVGDVRLDAGCHEVVLGLATPPGWGRARVRYLVRGVGAAPKGHESRTSGASSAQLGYKAPPTVLAGGHGAILRGAVHEVAAALERVSADNPGALLLRFRLESILDRRGPLEALVAQAAQPGRTDGAAQCLLWRSRLDGVLLTGDSEARQWIELWPASCRQTLPGQILEARHDADAGRPGQAADRATAVSDALEAEGLASCPATTTRIGQQAAQGEIAPLLLRQTPFCRQAAFADAAARGSMEDAGQAAALQERLMTPYENFPGVLQLARRLEAAGEQPAAQRLLLRLGWFDPDLIWARADMAPGGISAADLVAVTGSPLATTDLRSREGMLSSWAALDKLAASLESTLEAYKAAGWGEGALVMVFDETILRLRPQGRVTERTTRVYHLRTQQAAQDWTDFQVPDSGQVIRLRVRKSDGTWREPDALGAGDLANLGELAEGDVVVMETIDELDPPFALSDQLCLPAFYFSSRDVPVWRSRLVIQNETDQDLVATQFWGAPAPVEGASGIRIFEARRLETTATEDALQRWDAGLPRVEICTDGMSWPRLRDQLADGLLGQLTPDPTLRLLAAELRRGQDPVRAAFEEVRRTIAVDNRSLFARRAPEILADREGSAALLLLALLVEMDIQATLVLLDPPGGAMGLTGHADPGVHIEPVVRVPRAGETVWLDPFGPAARFGELRPFLGERPGLLMDSGGPHLRVWTPRVDPADHGINVRWDVRVRSDAGGTGDLTIRFTGIAGASLWERFRQAPKERSEEAVASFAQGFFPSAQVSTHRMKLDEGVLVFQVSVTFPAGAFDEPVLLRLGAGTLQRRYSAQSRRSLPIMLNGEALTTVEVRLSAPKGRRFKLQGNQGNVSTDFGRHQTLWERGRRLTIHHHSYLADHLLPASRYDELVSFSRAADAMDRLVLVLEHPH